MHQMLAHSLKPRCGRIDVDGRAAPVVDVLPILLLLVNGAAAWLDKAGALCFRL